MPPRPVEGDMLMLLDDDHHYLPHAIGAKSLGPKFNGLDEGKFYRKTPYLMGKSMVSCKFSLKPIH